MVLGLWPSLRGEQEPLLLEHPIDRALRGHHPPADELDPNLAVAVGGKGQSNFTIASRMLWVNPEVSSDEGGTSRIDEGASPVGRTFD